MPCIMGGIQLASTRKRGDAYQIRVLIKDESGNYISKSMTWKPENGMTERQIKKELERQEVLFEKQCKEGKVDSSIKVRELSDLWFEEYAKLNLKNTTLDKLYIVSERVNNALGELKLDELTARRIQTYINSLAKDGANMKTGAPLAQKTIKNHLGFISNILGYAVKMDMISENPCGKVSVPKGEKKEKQIYSVNEMLTLLSKLENEPLRYKVFFYLLAYSGFRKSEMLGLEWSDIDFGTCIVSIRRTSHHTTRHGTYTDTTKTKGSRRSIKVSEKIVDLLKQLKAEQKEKAVLYGSKWVNTNRVFTDEFGNVMGYGAPYDWLKKFCKRNDLPFYGLHSFMHFVASALINAGLDVTTVSGTLGHSNPGTTLNIYSHMFQSARARAAEVMDSALGFDKKVQVKNTYGK